jgi:uncharacterized protein YgiM (DUF1202 family)
MADKLVRVASAFPQDFFDGISQPPLAMREGEPLTVEVDTSAEWPAFVLVTNKEGKRGWVPERYLRRQGEKTVAIRRYDTTTLDPSEGEILKVIEEDLECGWVWCRDKKGNTGWFAINHLVTWH